VNFTFQRAPLHRLADSGANDGDVKRFVDVVGRAHRNAWRIVSVVSNAVIMIASMSGFTYLRRSSTSMPDMPAMRMSSTATSILFCCASSMAVGPSSAISKS